MEMGEKSKEATPVAASESPETKTDRSERPEKPVENDNPPSSSSNSPIQGQPSAHVLDRAIEEIKKAIMADKCAQYEEALALYMSAISQFSQALRQEMNPKNKAVLTEKLTSYIDRAEKLKAHLSGPAAKPASIVSPVPPAGGKSDDPSDVNGLSKGVENMAVSPVYRVLQLELLQRQDRSSNEQSV